MEALHALLAGKWTILGKESPKGIDRLSTHLACRLGFFSL